MNEKRVSILYIPSSTSSIYMYLYIPASSDNTHNWCQMIGQRQGNRSPYSSVLICIRGIQDFQSLVFKKFSYSPGADFLCIFPQQSERPFSRFTCKKIIYQEISQSFLMNMNKQMKLKMCSIFLFISFTIHIYVIKRICEILSLLRRQIKRLFLDL